MGPHLWGPVNGGTKAESDKAPAPQEAPISEGREMLRKVNACQEAAGLPWCPSSQQWGQLNVGMEDSTQVSNTGDPDNGGVTYKAGALESIKGPWKGNSQVEDLVSQ